MQKGELAVIQYKVGDVGKKTTQQFQLMQLHLYMHTQADFIYLDILMELGKKSPVFPHSK